MSKHLKSLVILAGIMIHYSALSSFLDVTDSDKEQKKMARSNWAFSLGIGNSKYFSDHSFEGTPVFNTTVNPQKKKFQHTFTPESINAPGLELIFRREFSISSRFSFSLGIGGHYYQSAKYEEFPIEEDSDINAAETKRKFDQYGFNLQFNLYLMHFYAWKAYKIQPYLNISYYQSTAETHYSYFFNNLGSNTSPTGVTPLNEGYNAKYIDELTTLKIGIGSEIIAPNGLFSFFQISFASPSATSREESGTELRGNNSPTNVCGSSSTCTRDAPEIDSFLSFNLGVGYRF